MIHTDERRHVVTMTVNGTPRKLPVKQLPAAADVTVEAVPIGAGKQVVHVRVPEKDAGEGGPAYEAVVERTRELGQSPAARKVGAKAKEELENRAPKAARAVEETASTVADAASAAAAQQGDDRPRSDESAASA